MAETQTLGIKRCQDVTLLLSTCFPGHCPISPQANPKLAGTVTAIGFHWIGHGICESFKLVRPPEPPPMHLKTLGAGTNAGG